VDIFVSPTRDTVAARTFFERAIASSGTTPRRVITDKAGAYRPALASAMPGVLHRTGRYRTNSIERHHGSRKQRLRPMRGPKSVASVAVFKCCHALMPSIRRGFHWIVESVPQRLVFAWAWNRLACCSGVIDYVSSGDRPIAGRTLVAAPQLHADAREPSSGL